MRPEVIDALLAAGATADMIAAAVKAEYLAAQADAERAQAAKREKAAERKRRSRHAMSRDVTVTEGMSRDVTVTSVTPSSPSPPKEVSPYNPLQEITPPSLPPSAAAPSRALADPEKDLFDRGKQILGKSAGGMIVQLLKAKGGKINLARAAIETSAGKENPREYIGRIIRGHDPPSGEASTYVDGRL